MWTEINRHRRNWTFHLYFPISIRNIPHNDKLSSESSVSHHNALSLQWSTFFFVMNFYQRIDLYHFNKFSFSGITYLPFTIVQCASSTQKFTWLSELARQNSLGTESVLFRFYSQYLNFCNIRMNFVQCQDCTRNTFTFFQFSTSFSNSLATASVYRFQYWLATRSLWLLINRVFV